MEFKKIVDEEGNIDRSIIGKLIGSDKLKEFCGIDDDCVKGLQQMLNLMYAGDYCDGGFFNLTNDKTGENLEFIVHLNVDSKLLP